MQTVVMQYDISSSTTHEVCLFEKEEFPFSSFPCISSYVLYSSCINIFMFSYYTIHLREKENKLCSAYVKTKYVGKYEVFTSTT